jgi:hypothetical protein
MNGAEFRTARNPEGRGIPNGAESRTAERPAAGTARAGPAPAAVPRAVCSRRPRRPGFRRPGSRALRILAPFGIWRRSEFSAVRARRRSGSPSFGLAVVRACRRSEFSALVVQIRLTSRRPTRGRVAGCRRLGAGPSGGPAVRGPAAGCAQAVSPADAVPDLAAVGASLRASQNLLTKSVTTMTCADGRILSTI